MSQLEPTSYEFRQRAPRWIWGLLSLCAVSGAVLIISGAANNWVLALWLGAVLLAVSLTASVLTGLAVRATLLRVRFDQAGYEIFNGGHTKAGRWEDVTDVSATPDGQRLIIRSGEVERSYIIAPHGDWSSKMAAITADLRARVTGG